MEHDNDEDKVENMEIDLNVSSPKPSTSQNGCTELMTPNNNESLLNGTLSLSSAKKSNLRKISKYESFSESYNLSLNLCSKDRVTLTTEGEDSPTPRKRIRIVEKEVEESPECQESVSVENRTNSISEENDLFSEMEMISGHTFQTNFGGEEMIWVSPPVALLDFSLIHEEAVRAARQPVTKKFSVEVDMRFIDADSINEMLEIKGLMMSVGFFNYEQISRISWPNNKSTEWKYPANALNLKSLDEGNNMDLTYPKEMLENEESNIIYFADIWTTSKGFREYILTKSTEYLRDGLILKGFAIQDSSGLRSKDFQPSCGLLFNSISTHTKSQSRYDEDLGSSLPVELVEHYKADDEKYRFHIDKSSGHDICDIAVSDEFVKNILGKTEGMGVHYLVADNHECLNVHETVREIRFQRKLYAQCIIALLTVREGGSFVVKVFDTITLFTVNCVFLLHRCFRNISIHKPKTSAPYSSERFIVCTGKFSCETSDEILQFLLTCHNMVMRNEEIRKIFRKKARRRLAINTYEVKQLVPLKVIIGHADFFEFLRIQNIRLATSVSKAVAELCAQIPRDCSWQLRKSITSHSESIAKAISLEELCAALLKDFKIDLNSIMASEHDSLLTQKDVLKISRFQNNWAIFPMQDCNRLQLKARPLTLYVGLGGDKVLYKDDSQQFKPVQVKGLVLTRGTVVFGSVVEVFSACNDANASVNLEFHILDAIKLNGQFVGDLSFAKRKKLCETYAAVLNKFGGLDCPKEIVIRVPEPLVLKESETVLKSWITSCVFLKENLCHYPSQLRLARFPDADSKTAMSCGGLLFYNVAGDVKNSLQKRAIWKWANPSTRPATLPIKTDFPHLNI